MTSPTQISADVGPRTRVRTFGRLPDRATIAFLVIALVGTALRVLFIFTTSHQYDSDNSIVYLMARHVAEGEIDWFYWGQSYGGTILQLTAGAVFTVTEPHAQLLSVIGVLYWLASAFLLRGIGVRAIGSLGGNLAAILYWMPGFFIVRESTLDPGFYGPGLCLGLGLIYLCLAREAPLAVLRWGAIGLLLGLSLWTSPAAFAMGLPAVVVAMNRDRSLARWAAALAAFGLGALPTFVSVVLTRGPVPGSGTSAMALLRSAIGMLVEMIPAALPGGQVWGLQFIIAAATTALLVWLVVIAVRRRSAWLLAVSVGTALVVIVTIVGAGNNILGSGHARYTVFVLPALTIAAADLARRRVALAAIVGATAVALTFAHTAVKTDGFAMGTSAAYGEDLIPVIEYLDRSGDNRVYASFWIAYRLSAATDERIIAADLAPRRYPDYEDEVRQSDTMTMVFYTGGPNDSWYRGDENLPPHHRTVLGAYVVYTFETVFDPYELPNGFI